MLAVWYHVSLYCDVKLNNLLSYYLSISLFFSLSFSPSLSVYLLHINTHTCTHTYVITKCWQFTTILIATFSYFHSYRQHAPLPRTKYMHPWVQNNDIKVPMKIYLVHERSLRITFHISMSQCKKDLTPLLIRWDYVFLVLTHRHVVAQENQTNKHPYWPNSTWFTIISPAYSKTKIMGTVFLNRVENWHTAITAC